ISLTSGNLNTHAELVARDSVNDLALLRTPSAVPEIAELRSDAYPLTEDERVFTVGYPGGKGPTTREATAISPAGPNGELQWVLFSDSIAKGTSGGPLLDASGNVVGVVTSKVVVKESLESDPATTLKRQNADLAMSLVAVRNFLSGQRIRYQ